MIYTIGYGAQKKPRLPALKLDELARIREQLGAVIVDVRARPWSRWRKELDKPVMQKRFRENYISAAAVLGNQSKSLPGKVDPDGIDWLRPGNFRHPQTDHRELLLMCLEKHPRDCHRHHAIAMQLPSGSVAHLYHDGKSWRSIEAHALQRAIDAGVPRGVGIALEPWMNIDDLFSTALV